MKNDSKANRAEIAKRIKNARKNAGFTQAEVAKKLNLTPQAISNYERGINSVPVTLLFALADLYGLKKFSFLDSLPETYQFAQACIGDLQYDCLQYELELNNELSNTLDFERRSLIQSKIREVCPNEVELFLAEKLQYGTHPNNEHCPVSYSEIELVGLLLDSLLLFAIENNDSRCQHAYIRISKLISLLQAYQKIKEGHEFIYEEPIGTLHPNSNLSEYIKKEDPANPPKKDYIIKSHREDEIPVLFLRTAPTNKEKT